MTASATLNDTLVGESGPVVVFLHGLFGQARNFTQIAKSLEPDYRSLLVDLPNHGRSGWTDDIDYVTIADLVADHLRAGVAADGPVHVVGHSMGGKIAMVLALRHADLVDRLVVVDISPTGSSDSSEFEHLLDSLAGLDLTTLTRRAEADERLTDQIGDARVRGFLLQNLRSHDGSFHWQANLDVLRQGLERIGGFPRLDGTFDHPVLWIAGEKSPYISGDDEPAMRAFFPRTQLVTVKNAGHWVHSEQPEAFVSILRVFLAA